jgi:membrane associated rhomboid family serine protease
MSRADLFVVCKNPDCGAEVSPYVTECPYCGTRLQKRAPKLDKGLQPARRLRRMPSPSLGRLRPGEIPGIRADRPPYCTGAIILATAIFWIATRAGWLAASDLVVNGPLHSHWSRVLTAPFTYFYVTSASDLTGSGVYQFATLFAVAIFGWLLERRHGPAVVLALFLAVGVAGGLVAEAVYSQPLVSGGAAAALGLLAAWVVPDLEAVRTRGYYDGDLLGTGALAAVLLAMPLARPEANWLAVLAGGMLGLVLGLGLSRIGRA